MIGCLILSTSKIGNMLPITTVKSQILRYNVISEMFKYENSVYLRIDGMWYIWEIFQFYFIETYSFFMAA